MECNGCPYYKSGFQYNACGITESENFHQQENCTLVNDDGSVNFEDDYFKNT